MKKECRYKLTYDDTIVELQFVSPFRRGAWKTDIQPFINIMKQLIPASAREYNPNTFKWSLAIEYWEPFKKILETANFTLTLDTRVSANGPHVEVPKEYAENFFHSNAPVTSKESAESIAKALTAFLGVDVSTKDVKELKSLYRRKALELHPDRAPERAGEMSELNRLWTLFNTTERVQ